MTRTPSVTPSNSQATTPTPTPTPSISSPPVGAVYFVVYPAASACPQQDPCPDPTPGGCDCYTGDPTGARCNNGNMEVVSSCVAQNSGNGILTYTQCNGSITISDTPGNPITSLGLRCSDKIIAKGYISSGFVPDDGTAITLNSTQKAYSPVDGCCVQNINMNYNVSFDSFLTKLSTACGSGTVADPYRIFTQGSEPQFPCEPCP